jgi:transposase
MDQYELIRTAARVYQKSIRQIARETGHTRKTIRKALAGWEPKYRRSHEPACRVMASVAPIIDGWLRADQEAPTKQRHTAHRIWTRLVDEYGFTGAESTVRRWVREHKRHVGWAPVTAVLPLDPEIAREAEVDWGVAWVRMAVEERQVRLFCLRSRYSGLAFVRAYPYERQEMFLDGHLRAFAFFGGVFPVLVYDNLTTAVRRILHGKARVEQERFVAFRSYYTFQARFCTPAQGREKGGVEGLVGFARRNFLVPLPEVKDFDELNELLLRRCLAQGARRISGRDDRRTIAERHQEEQTRLLPLPDRPFENTKVLAVRISPYQTAQVDRNRYSVPTAYVGRWVWAHVGCDRVALYADARQVAAHPRVFGIGQWQLDPLHYLDVLEQRVGAFEAARAIRQWRPCWPEQYERMLQGLRRRHGESHGTREFVRILKLHQDAPAARVADAVAEALRLQTYSLEAVRHLLRRQEPVLNPVPLAANLLPGITDRVIAQTEVGCYDRLLAGVAR